jgi:hypothetical protein
MGMKPPLCDHYTSRFSKEQRRFMCCTTDSLPVPAIFCKQRDTSAFGKSKNESPRSTVSVTMLENIIHYMVE